MIKLQVKGLSELQENLRYFGRVIEERILRRALARAVTPATTAIRKATYTTVTRRTGLLQRGLGARVIRAPQPGGRIAAGVFSRPATKGFVAKLRKAGKLRTRTTGRGFIAKGKTKEITVPFYWRFIEFGTARAKARPYVRRAFEGAAPAMIEAFTNAVRAGIDRAAAQRPHK